MKLQTLAQYLLSESTQNQQEKDIAKIITQIALIGEYISRQTNKAGLVDILGEHGTKNSHGEHVQKLDIFANELCKERLAATGLFCAMASEEEEAVIDTGKEHVDAPYVIAFDPLDGSSNIDVNVSIGTIFSVHKRIDTESAVSKKHFLQKGTEQLLAGYVLYGSSTVLVFSTGNGVQEFTLDPDTKDFFHSIDTMNMPQTITYYSVNESNLGYMKQQDRDYVAWLREESGASSRYIGSLVADVHRTLLKGGVFLYPEIDKEGQGKYKGKLRMNYELKPMAFLVEQAGGIAKSEDMRILDIVPDALHEKRSIFIGPNQ